MPDQPKQPDIEIYVKDTSFNAIQNWLSSIFEPITLPSFSGKPIHISIGSSPKIAVMLTPNAAGKAFTSIWFQSDQTPWVNDEECAVSFLALHDTEVRCSANSWQEEEEEHSEQWLSISRNEKRLIQWG
ncbi:MAG: hypothetical protein ACI84K_000554 [Pseudohongiellaceae bacterium]|jgi:hypothetical protein